MQSITTDRIRSGAEIVISALVCGGAGAGLWWLLHGSPEWTLERSLEVAALLGVLLPFAPFVIWLVITHEWAPAKHPHPFGVWVKAQLLGTSSSLMAVIGYAGLVWALVGHNDIAAGWVIGTIVTLAYWAFMVKRLGWRCLAQFAFIGIAFIVRGTYGTISHGGIMGSHRLPMFLLILGSAMLVATVCVWLVAHRGRIVADVKKPFKKAWNSLGGGDIDA